MSLIVTDKLTKKDLLAHRPDVYLIAVDSLERDVGEVAQQLQAVLDIRKERKRPKVVAMTFTGFDEDHRELDAIPEVGAWCRRFLDSVTSSTLMALTDERRPPMNPFHREALAGAIGRAKFVALAGYGKRDGHHLALTVEGVMVLEALAGHHQGRS